MKHNLNLSLRSVLGLAVSMLSISAFAGRYWLGATEGALFSDTANWATSSGGTGGNSYPGSAGNEGTTYFRNYLNGLCVFDVACDNGSSGVSIGTANSSYFVWRADDPAYGVTTTGEFLLGYDSKTPSYLQVDGGTYSFGTSRIGASKNAVVGLLLNGGSFTAKTLRVGGGYEGVDGTVTIKGGTLGTTDTGSETMSVCNVAGTKGTMIVDGGTLDTTAGYVSMGYVANVEALVNVKSGTWNAKGFRMGGKTGSTKGSAVNVANSISRIVMDGGTLNFTAESGIGEATGDGSYAEIVVNDGDINCNYGYFYIGECGPGRLTMNGGTFTMVNSSGNNGGLGLGRTGSACPGTLTLNGGVLTTERLRLNYTQAGSKVYFNGGTIKPTRSIDSASDSFINENANLECVIMSQGGGLIIDTAGYNVTIAHPFIGEDGLAATESANIGTITKKGSGRLTLSAAFPEANIIVEKGTVVANGKTYEAATNDTVNQSRYWRGTADGDNTFSDSENWAATSGGESGASAPDDDFLGSVYFDDTVVSSGVSFDTSVELSKNLQIGTKSATPFVWSATAAANGLKLPSNDLIVGYATAKSPTHLQIDSGTYSCNYLRLGLGDYSNGSTTTVTMNGGSLTSTQGRVGVADNDISTMTVNGGTYKATSSIYVVSGGKSGQKATLTVDGGTLDTTGPDYVRIGQSGSSSTATVHVVSGAWNTKSFLVGGGTKQSRGNYPGMLAQLIVDGGTVTASADSSIGANVGDDSRSEMIVNQNGTVVINANCLYVGDGGPGYLTINGGSLKISNTTHGLSFGHYNGKTAGTNVDPSFVTLNGGVLEIPKFRLDYVVPGSKIVFNGGTVKATRTQTEFLNATENLVCEIAAGGLIVDTAGYDITIAHDLTGVGGIVKKGNGTLTLAGSNTFTGEITVEAGGVNNNGQAIGLTNDPSSYTTTLTVTENGADFGTVQLHRNPLATWLADNDFETYDSTYDAHGTESKETPRYIAVEANGETATFMNLNTSSNVTGTVGGLAYSFTTESVAPRTLRIDYPSGRAANVRDCGSWPLETLNGKKMNQDVIFRGGNLDGMTSASAEQKSATYLTKIGLKSEIDLRRVGLDTSMADDYKNLAADGTDRSFAADNCAYYRFDLGWGTGDGTQIGADDNGTFTNQIRKVFSTWGTEGNLPTYFHCQIGTDRTGVTGLLLLGLMGVEEEVLYRDYLMSNFANIGGKRDTAIPEQFLKYILRGYCNSGKYVYDTKDGQYGSSVASRCRQYLEMCGVTAAELETITMALSGETLQQVLERVDAYETENNFRTVSYVPYPGSSTTNAIHRFGTNGKRILPRDTPTKSGDTFVEWDVANETVYDEDTGNSVVYAKWASSIEPEPQTYKWDNNAGDFNLANGGNWYVSGTDPRTYGKPTIIDTCQVEANGSYLVLTNGEAFSAAKFEFTNGSETQYPILDITNGTFTVDGNFNLGYWGHRGEVNVFDGVVDIKNLLVGDYGSREYNKFNVYGGNVTIRNSFKIGTNIDARGDVSISGGTVTSLASIALGDSNLSAVGGPETNYKSTLNLTDGTLSVTGDVNVASPTSAGGVFNVLKGESAISGDLNIAGGSNSWGQVDISGGTVTVGGTIRVGNHAYAQHAVLNISGGTLDVKNLSVACQCDGYVYVTDGGTICAEQIDKAQGAPSTAHPYFYFDDGTIVAKSDYQYTFASSSGITLGAAGLAFDTAGFSPKIQAFTAIDGIGGITKKGEGKLELVAKSFGFAGAYNAHGVITVEKGTLKMPSGQTFYVEGTNVAEGATLDLNGSSLVLVTKMIADSVWTNAAGDRDATNPVNWTSVVKYYGEDGNEIDSIRATLDGVLPTSDSDVRISVDSIYPANLDPASVKSVTYASARDISLILDFAATYDNYAAPSLAVSGDVKILNDFAALLNSAAAWYDPSDSDTLTTNEAGVVSAIANKGHAGATMDGSAYDANSLPYVDDSGWLNFSNCLGFVSTGKVSLPEDRGRSLFSVNIREDLWETENEKQIFPISMANDETYGNRFFAIECWSWQPPNFFKFSSGESEVVGNGNTEGTAYVRSFVAANGVANADTVDYDNGTLRTRNSTKAYEDELISGVTPYVYYGMRRLYKSPSLGKIGEALAYDYGLSITESAAVRQYLAAKWLEGEAEMPAAGTTTLDSLILENANVDMDGAAVSVGILGGSGTITNLSALAVTGGLSFGLDENGDPEGIVVYGDVDLSDAEYMDIDPSLCALVGTPGHSVIPLIEIAGEVNFGKKRHFTAGGRNYSVSVIPSGDKHLVVLGPGNGFFIRLR